MTQAPKFQVKEINFENPYTLSKGKLMPTSEVAKEDKEKEELHRKA